MTKKKVILTSAVVFVLLVLLIVYFILTRQTYWRNNYPQSQYLKQSDADYLETWDLRLISTNDDDDYLLELGKKICSSANTSGKHNNDYMDIISDVNYNKITYSNLFPMELANKCDYSITETDVLSKNNKAIFFCRDKYTGFDADGKKVFGGENSSFPLRLYFEKENGKWKVKYVSVPL